MQFEGTSKRRPLNVQYIENSEISLERGPFIYVKKIGPFMDTGYFNILQQTDTEDKEKASENQKISEAFVELINPLVIRLGFEPRTPSLKGMCSTY